MLEWKQDSGVGTRKNTNGNEYRDEMNKVNPKQLSPLGRMDRTEQIGLTHVFTTCGLGSTLVQTMTSEDKRYVFGITRVVSSHLSKLNVRHINQSGLT